MARVPLSKRRRFAVLMRDNFRCVYCGRTAADVELHVDHITPVIMGGDNTLVNLATSCSDCNLGKGAAELDLRSGEDGLDAFERQLQREREQRVADLFSLWKLVCGTPAKSQEALVRETLAQMTAHIGGYSPNWAQQLILDAGRHDEIAPRDRLAWLRYRLCYEALHLGLLWDPLFVQGDGVYEPPWEHWPEMHRILHGLPACPAEVC